MTTRPNPYIGPRAFRTGETLYGRDREVHELLDLLIAERIVALYSPSGAGKTSLVQAALIPRLAEDDFHVLPPMRVNAEPPADLAAGQPRPNRFVLSLLLSLEEDVPDEQQMPIEQLARLQLADYLQQRPRLADAPESDVLIFDQFEEILTVDPTNQDDRIDFFAQVGAALRDKNRWALFSMREDFLATLDPFVRSVPTRLANTFRLDLLGEAAARAAMQEPAQRAGVDFTDAAAAKLVNDLRRIKVQRADGTTEDRAGQYVEPVQLQVVCYRLWEHLEPDAMRIDESNVESVGDVDSVLAGYYADQVAAIARATGVSERSIRDWFDRRLITEQGIRGQVLWGGALSEGLEDRAIRPLIDAHLVRSEKRRGAVWFELSHDRMIDPIRKNNAAWREANLNELQRRAAVWDQQHRPDGLLLRGGELTFAEQWSAEHASELTLAEHDFLVASREARDIALREKRRNRLVQRLAIGMTVFSILAVIAFVAALISFNTALRQKQLAGIRQLVAQSSGLLETQPQRSLLLALEALNLANIPGPPGPDDTSNYRQDAEDALRRALVNYGGLVLSGHTNKVWSTAFSPDSHWAVTAGTDGVVRLWNLDFPDPGVLSFELLGHTAGKDIRALAVSPDSHWLVSGSDDGTARVWDLSADNPATVPPFVLGGHAGAVRAVVFSPDGKWIITGSSDKTARVWSVDALIRSGSTQPDPAATSILLKGHNGGVLAVAVSKDNRWIATGSGDATARLWDLQKLAADPTTPPAYIELRGHTDAVSVLAFSPSDIAAQLATGSEDATVRLWDVAADDPAASSIVLGGNEEGILSIAFSRDGQWLATGGFDRTVRLWDVWQPDPASALLTLHGHTDQVSSIAFSSDRRWLISGGRDATVRLWDLHAPDPEAASFALRGHEGWIRAVTVSENNRWILSGSEDNTGRLWGVTIPDSNSVPAVLRGHTSLVRAVVFSDDRKWLATAGGDGDVRLWDMTSPDPAAQSIVLPGHGSSIFGMDISADGRWLAAGGQDAVVQIWDLSGPRGPSITPYRLTGHTKTIRAVTFSSNGHWLVTAGRDATVLRWDMTATPPVSITLSGHKSLIRLAVISDDNRWLVTAGDGGEARLWTLALPDPNRSVITLAGHTDAVRAAAFSYDGRWLVTGGDDAIPRLWDLNKINNPTEAMTPLIDPTGAPAATIALLAFTHDDRWLVSTHFDNIIRVWDMRDLSRPRFYLRGHTAGVRALDISADDRWLLTGSEDSTARLWDLSKADPSAESILLPGHREPVWGVAISPDGRWMATGSGDARVNLWTPVLPEQLVALACQRVGRNLTSNEIALYAIDVPAGHRTCPNPPVVNTAP